MSSAQLKYAKYYNFRHYYQIRFLQNNTLLQFDTHHAQGSNTQVHVYSNTQGAS